MGAVLWLCAAGSTLLRKQLVEASALIASML
jgi:hypothetical protein